MSESGGQKHEQDGSTAQRDLVMLVLVVATPDSLDDLVTAMLDFGIGGTMVESKGLAAHLREEMPIFSGLASLLPRATGSRMVFSVAPREQVDQMLDFIEGEMDHARRPIGVTLSLEKIVGLQT